MDMNMKITCRKDELIAKVRGARAEHEAIAREARDGYRQKAVALASHWLDQLESGKVVRFEQPRDLPVPMAYLNQFDAALAMLEAHTGDTLEISMTDYRMLALGEWEWARMFHSVASNYSPSARTKLAHDEG